MEGSALWIVFVAAGVAWMVRPLVSTALLRRKLIARPSEQFETPERKRIALRLERFEPWFFYIGGLGMVLFGLALGFMPDLAPIASAGFLIIAALAVVFYGISVYSRR